MTKRHFIALAKRIAEIGNYPARCLAADAVAKACAEFNPAFDRTRFLEACKVSAEIVTNREFHA